MRDRSQRGEKRGQRRLHPADGVGREGYRERDRSEDGELDP
jgi:hypothetical protein